MKMVNALLILLLFSSCVAHFEDKEIIGIYTPSDYKNNFDTLELKPNGTYERKVYDKNKKLLLEMKSNWSLVEQGSKIKIDGFYFNLDDDLLKFPHLAKDTNMVMQCVLEKENDILQFCVGYYAPKLSNQNCYKKIK
jgi:hypothetical protein